MLTFGNLKMPYLNSSDQPDIGGQALAQGQRLELISGAGPALAADAAAITALVASDGFNGLIMEQLDTGQLWLRKAGATIPLPVNARRQLDTTNTTGAMRLQVGHGKITGATAVTITETMTFPDAFTEVPFVLVTYAGRKASGAFDMTSLLATTTDIIVGATVPTTTNFAPRISSASGANLLNTNDYYYSWIAIGAA